MACVMIKADGIRAMGNGFFEVNLPSRELTFEEKTFLSQVFPNLIERAYDLINQEILLSSIALPHEKPMKSKTKYPLEQTQTPTY